MIHGDLKGVGLPDLPRSSTSDISFFKANTLIDESGRACLADFGLLTIALDATSLVSSSSLTRGGTHRWMSPELLFPDEFGLPDSRRTKYSDCYAFGMVIYEVLSGKTPFYHYEAFAAIAKVGKGGRPERPQGAEGKWFTDILWNILERCWAHKREGRPMIEDVLQFLEEASGSWTPPSPLTTEGPTTMDSPTWSIFYISAEEGTGGVPFITQVVPSQPSQTLPPRCGADNDSAHPSSGGFPVLVHKPPDHQDLEPIVKNSKGSDLGKSAGIPDGVSAPAFLCGIWY